MYPSVKISGTSMVMFLPSLNEIYCEQYSVQHTCTYMSPQVCLCTIEVKCADLRQNCIGANNHIFGNFFSSLVAVFPCSGMKVSQTGKKKKKKGPRAFSTSFSLLDQVKEGRDEIKIYRDFQKALMKEEGVQQ